MATASSKGDTEVNLKVAHLPDAATSHPFNQSTTLLLLALKVTTTTTPAAEATSKITAILLVTPQVVSVVNKITATLLVSPLLLLRKATKLKVSRIKVATHSNHPRLRLLR